jgi:hypothetical protein
MSEATVRKVIGQAIVDLEYRELLFKDPDKALEGLDLTAEEVANLKAMEHAAFEAEGDGLEARISRASTVGMHLYGCGAKTYTALP